MISKKEVIKNIPNVVKTVNITGFGKKHQGKVRDSYEIDGKRIIITTDRQSAFDRVLGFIPFKGQVLTRLSEFWFRKTEDIFKTTCFWFPIRMSWWLKIVRLFLLKW